MSKPATTITEQQLAERLRQAAAIQAANLAPLAWSVVAPRSWWQRPLLALASAAAIAWLLLADVSLWPLPLAPDAAAIPPMLMAEQYHLEALDQHIQQAYLRGADEQTIEQLWQQRQYWTEQHRLYQEWSQ
jgi:hypothetical protein